MCQYCSTYSEVIGNITDVNIIAQEVHKSFVIPGILTTYILSFLLLIIIGRITIKSSQGFGKFFLIWFASVIFIGFFVLLILLKPSILVWIVKLFKTN